MTAAIDAASAAGMVTVHLPAALVALFPGAERRVSLPAGRLAALIDALDTRWPGMADRIRDGRPSVRRHINVLVDGERVGLDDEIRPGADVWILLAISGG